MSSVIFWNSLVTRKWPSYETLSSCRAAFYADVGLRYSSEDIVGKLNSFSFFFGIPIRSAESIIARIFTCPRSETPIEFEVSLNMHADTIRSSVGAAVLDPVTILIKTYI